MKKRIALLSQFGNPVRGLSPYSDCLFAELNKQENISISKVDYKSPFPSFLHPAKAETVKIDSDLTWWNPFSWIRISSLEFDVIHIQHWLSPMSFYLLPITWIAKRNGKKVVITVHNPEAHEHSLGFRTIESQFFSCADAIIVHTKRGADLLQKRISDKVNLTVIPHGISNNSKPLQFVTAQELKKVGLSSEYRYILIFGNLRGYKGIEMLLDVWRDVSAEYPNVRLIVGGRLWGGKGVVSKFGAALAGTIQKSALIADKLDALVKEEKAVYFPGFLPDETIDTLIRCSDFCIFPYEKFESQSGAACRAVGLASPVLVSRVGGLPDLALDESWIIEPNNQIALHSALKRKLDSTAENAVTVDLNAKFSEMLWSSVATATVHVYSELFSEKSS